MWPTFEYLGPLSGLGLNRVPVETALGSSRHPPLDSGSAITRCCFSTTRCVDELQRDVVAHCTRCIVCAASSARVAACRCLPLPRCRRDATATAQPSSTLRRCARRCCCCRREHASVYAGRPLQRAGCRAPNKQLVLYFSARAFT